MAVCDLVTRTQILVTAVPDGWRVSYWIVMVCFLLEKYL